MPDRFAYDVFLSHNAKDKPRVRRLAERLKQAGLRVWFDEWNVGPGDIIALKVDDGLERSRALLLCVSPNALASGWVALERSTAIHRDPANAGRRFIPLLLADCDMPDTLRRYKYVDFREEAEAAFAELVTVCRPEGGEVTGTAKPAKKKPAKEQPQPRKPPEKTEPIAVLERELEGHNGWVRSVAVSPDGKWAASGSEDHAVKIWDLETGECRATLEGHWHEVSSVAITPDGKWVLSGSKDHSIRVWDVTNRLKLTVSWDHDNFVNNVCSLADAAHGFSAGNDDSLKIWKISSGECVATLHTGMLWSGTISPDGKLALAGGRAELELWDFVSKQRTAVLKGHSDTVNFVQISRDGTFAVSGSGDKTVKVWDLEAGKCIGTLEGHQAQVLSVAISPDGNMIASTGFTDHTVRLWDRKSGTCLAVIEQDASPISVAFSPQGSRLVVGTAAARMIYVYRLIGVRPAPAAEATRRYVNAKIVLIGEGTVGKTSLAHRLIEDKYVVRDRTHGMNVWRLDFPDAGHDNLDREALLWDLAGQEDYRLIHQLFLDETALALLLINPQNADPFAEAGDWLEALKTAAGNLASKREAVRLLIFSQIDVGGMKLGNAKIERFREQHGFAGWLPTSAKTGENCSDKKNGGQPSKLKQLIAKSTPWDRLPWTSTPRLLAELKNAVVAMRDQRDIRLLRFSELAQRLEQALPGEKFGESDVRTAVTLLANHGLARPLKFGDLVLLQPELINGYAGAIVRAARAHTDEIGCVLEADIYQPGFDFTGVDRLKHRPDEELLLRALTQTFLDHSLCIAEDTPHGRHLVFPSQYRREKDIPYEPDIFVSYTFSGHAVALLQRGRTEANR